MSTHEEMREEGEQRKRDLANGWRPDWRAKNEFISPTMPHIARMADEAGMTYWGDNTDGQMEFVGTETQWRNFRDLVFNDERAHA